MDYCSSEAPDLLVISGDLTRDDADAATCRWMKSKLPPAIPAVVIPGNHDSAQVLYEVFADSFNPTPDFCFALNFDDTDVLFTNSGSGVFPTTQLDWLGQRRTRENAIMFTHYPTKKLSDGFMDRTYPLLNIDEADAAIRATRISHVFCGHFHTDYDVLDGYHLHVTPSPAFTLDLHATEPALTRPFTPVQQIEIADGQVTAHVHYLDSRT